MFDTNPFRAISAGVSICDTEIHLNGNEETLALFSLRDMQSSFTFDADLAYDFHLSFSISVRNFTLLRQFI